jgi:hypothetical protein
MPAHLTRVVFILPTLAAGGAERVLIKLINGLDRNPFAPELISLYGSGPLGGWIAEDTPFHSLGYLKIRNGLPKLAAKLNEIGPDIVVSTMAGMNFGVLLVKPFLKKRPKIIVREAVVPSSIIDAQPVPWLVRAAYRIFIPTPTW